MISDEAATAYQFLQCLYGADAPGWLTIWLFPSKYTHWIHPQNLEAAAAYAVKQSQQCDVYLGVGLRGERLKKGRGEAQDVIALPALYVDIDIRHAVHKVDNLPESIEEARQLLTPIDLPPSLLIHSGHGLQAWWLLRELWRFETADERQEATHVNAHLQATIRHTAHLHGWHVDGTADLARVLRIPGTCNRKVANQVVPVTILDDHPERRYNVSDFEPYLIERDADASNPRRHSDPLPDALPFIHVATLKLHRWLKYLIRTAEHPDDANRYSDRSTPEWAALQGMIEAGYDDLTIAGVMLNPKHDISAKPREKGRRWVEQEIARARAKADASYGHQRTDDNTSNQSGQAPAGEGDDLHNSSTNDGREQRKTDDPPRNHPPQQLGGVKAKTDGYYRVRMIKEDWIETRISSFIVQPTLRIWIDGSEAVRAHIRAGKSTVAEVTIERHCWHSRGAFLKVLPSLDQWCVATDNEIQAIQALVASQTVPSKRGTRTLGFVGDVWVSDEGIFNASGWIEDPSLVYLPPSGESPLAGRLRYRVQDASERLPIAETVYQHIWQLNELTVIGALIGWFFATPCKPLIHARLGHFPVLNVWGTMGAGKTSLLRLFWRLFGVDSELLACTDTEFSLLSLLSATGSIPLVFDEFKPYDMKLDQVRRFERILRRVYDGDTEHRGRPDLRLITYRLMAPVAVAGEVSVARQPAMRERIIPVSPSKTWLPEHEDARKAYGDLVKLPLHAFASLFLEWSMRQDFSSHWSAAEKVLREYLDRDIPERLLDGLRVLAFGLRQFEQFGLAHGLPVPEQLDLGVIVTGILDQLLSANGRSRVGLDVLLEHLSVMAELGRLIEGQHYMARKVDSYLALRLDSCLAEYRRYAKDTASDDEVLSKESYLRQLRENHESKGGYVLEVSGRVYFGKDQLRAVLISREKAEASGIDLDGFTREHD